MVSSLVTSRQMKQIKDLEFISSNKYAFGSCLTGATNVKSEEISMQVRKVIIWLQKQNKSVKEIEKTLGVANSAVQ